MVGSTTCHHPEFDPRSNSLSVPGSTLGRILEKCLNWRFRRVLCLVKSVVAKHGLSFLVVKGEVLVRSNHLVALSNLCS